MLTNQDIVTLSLDPIDPMVPVPMPHYVGASANATTRAFVALSDEVLVKLFHISRPVFNSQLQHARHNRVSLLGLDSDGARVGVIAYGSKIGLTDSVLEKKLFVPLWLLKLSGAAASNIVVVSYFVRSDPSRSQITEAEVAGWIDGTGACAEAQAVSSPRFSSKLGVAAIPCQRLRPMSELGRITPETSL